MGSARSRHRPGNWFRVEPVDDATWAIHLPRYWQRNVCHLLAGRDRALLVDTGPGASDIASVVSQLTRAPVTALATHLHWDHVGGHAAVGHVAAPDLPRWRMLAPSDRFRSRPSSSLSLRRHRFRVDDWVDPNGSIDLGGRVVHLQHTPGHTDDSITVVDHDRRQVYTGDLLYDGPLAFGLLPGSDLAAAQRSLAQLSRTCDPMIVLGGHYAAMPGRRLHDVAEAIQDVTPLRSGPGWSRARAAGFTIVQSALPVPGRR